MGEGKSMKSIATKLAKWFKALPFAGRFRFWCLYWAYRITGWHIRHKEWDFVLQYLPKLGKWQEVYVLDVGCSRNLFCHEVVGRGYKLVGIDMEKPHFKYPGIFHIWDIRKFTDIERNGFGHEFITCISVLEHIGNNGRGKIEDQELALLNMVNALKIRGRLLLTCPTREFAQGHIWEGFDYIKIHSMLPVNARIIEYTERAGQLCMAI